MSKSARGTGITLPIDWRGPSRALPTCPVVPVSRMRIRPSRTRAAARLQPEAGPGHPLATIRVFDTPLDPDRRVVMANRDLVAWAIELIAFIEEIRSFRQNNKSVRKTPRHPELPAVVLHKLDRDVATEGWATLADVDRNIEDTSP